MSDLTILPVEHHLYGSTPKGFATLHSPENVDRATLLGLERRCGYALPSDPGMQIPAKTPVKHACFAAEDRLVVSRAVYLGIDATGRRGNYLCHQLVVNRQMAGRQFEDPVSLMDAIEVAGGFLDAVPANWSELPSSLTLVKADASPPALSHELMHALLTVCFGWDKTQAPALIIGDDHAFRRLLSAALLALPSARRWALPFDSYIFGADWREIAFVGLPSAREFARGLAAWSLRVDAESGTCEWRKQLPEAPIVSYLTAAVPARERDAVAACIDHIELRAWDRLSADLASLDDRGVQAIYASYREPLLECLASQGDNEVAERLAGSMTPADLELLGRNDAFARLQAAPAIRTRMVAAALTTGASSSLLRWIVADRLLLDTLLKTMDYHLSSPAGLDLAERLVRLLPPSDVQSGYFIFRAIGSAYRTLRPDPAAAASLVAAIRALPLPDPTLDSYRFYALDCLGDRDAFQQLLADPEVSIATFANSQPPSLAAYVLRSRLRDNAKMRKPLEMLVAAVTQRRLPPEAFRSPCLEILYDQTFDAKLKKSFAKDLESALDAAPDTPWVDDLLAACDAQSGSAKGSFFSRRRKS